MFAMAMSVMSTGTAVATPILETRVVRMLERRIVAVEDVVVVDIVVVELRMWSEVVVVGRGNSGKDSQYPYDEQRPASRKKSYRLCCW